MNTTPALTAQPRKMTSLEYARAVANNNPDAPVYWMTNSEVLELLEQIAELKQSQQPAPILFPAFFVEATA